MISFPIGNSSFTDGDECNDDECDRVRTSSLCLMRRLLTDIYADKFLDINEYSTSNREKEGKEEFRCEEGGFIVDKSDDDSDENDDDNANDMI